MKRAAVILLVTACGGQIADEPNDASGGDVAPKIDASDASFPIDVGVFDVTGIDDTTNPPTCQLATTNLVAYFPLDGETTDHSGHGFDAVGTDIISQPGLIDGSFYFNGKTSTLRIANGTTSLSGPRTLCAWARPNTTTGAGQPLFWGGYSSKGDFYAVFSSAPSNTTCTKTVASTPYVDHWGFDCLEASLPPVPIGQWSLVCYAYDGGAVELSVDGIENKTTGALYDYPLSTLFIGSTLGDGTTTKGSFDGDIDEVSVWSVRLQGSDLAALWNNGVGCTL